jgi:hypothetical protein
MTTQPEGGHNWPADQDEHVWDRWWTQKGPPNATEYRTCIHPDCNAIEYRDVRT